MTVEEIMTALLGPGADTALVKIYASIAMQEACAYCMRTELPEEANGTIAQIGVIKYNRHGTEGTSSESYSGISESYIDGYPGEIKAALTRWRKLVVL